MIWLELISVVMPTYNREKTIIRAVNSVLNQTYKNIELIVVDDCSSDNTIKLLNEIKDPRLKIIKLEKNSGACHARNVGIKNSKGNLIAFQDSDDEWHINKLEKQVKYLDKYDLVFCRFKRNESETFPNIKYELDEFDAYKKLLIENIIGTSLILTKKEILIKNLFDEKLPRFQDWDLVLRISKKYKIKYLKEVLSNVYVQKDSISKNHESALKALEIIYEKNKDEIENNKKIKASFLQKKCIFKIKTGMYCKKEAKELFELNKNFKNFIILIINVFYLIPLYKKIKK